MPPPVWGGGLRSPTRREPPPRGFRSGVHNWEVHERQDTRPRLHSGRRSGASKGLTLLSFSHFQDAHGSRQKIRLKLPARGLHKAAPLSRLALRRPPLQRLPHHHTPPPRLRPSFSRARDPARRRRPRKRRSASSAACRHGGSRFTCPGSTGPSRHHVSSQSGRPQVSRLGSASPAEASLPFQAPG